MAETVLVTGGAGFIGSHVVDLLLGQGFKVKVLDDLSHGRKQNLSESFKEIEFVEGDIRNFDLVKQLSHNVDFILHQAALRSVFESVEAPRQYNEVNINGTLNVLEAARQNNVKRVVYASSSSVYGNSQNFPLEESVVGAPISPYALSKLAGEHYARLYFELYGLETVSLRYFNVFGPRQSLSKGYSRVVPAFITALLEGRQPTIYGDGKQSRDFTFIGNVAEANLAALRADKKVCGQAFNVGSGQTTNLLELLGKISALMGKNVEPRFEPLRQGDVRKTLASIEKSQSVLGWQNKFSLGQGLEQTIGWLKEGDYLG